MKLDLKHLSGSSILAGAMQGRMALNKLLEQVALEPPEPEIIFLDFCNIRVATVSFLRESVFAFRDIVRSRNSAFYPVVANAVECIQDELVEILRIRHDALLTCTLTKSGAVTDAALLGELDPKQSLTFRLVCKHGETNAGTLMRDYGQAEGVKHPTTWNNRLAALAARGLVIEQTQGRAKRYRPLLEGV